MPALPRSPAKQTVESAPFVRVQPRVPERFLAAPVRFQVVLNENADAMGAALAVADRVDSIRIAEDQVPRLGFRAENDTRADARVPSARLFEPGQVINLRGGSGQHQSPLFGGVQGKGVLASEQHETI